jgi:FMN phosphatase YigB (HAD superfamily)
MYQLRTIDVWDTLLRRTCHPDFIKLATARYLVLTERARLNVHYREHWAVFKERCRIEGELALEARGNGGDDEYTLDTVLSRLLHRVLAREEADIPDLTRRLAAVELEFEYQNTYADPACRDFLSRFPAPRSLFLSDFYMSGDSLRGLLQHHGLHDVVDGGISSCDIGLNKRSGNLFRHIHAIYRVSPDQHVHIGDNRHSDVEVPRRMGVHARHYQPAPEHAARIAREQVFADRGALLTHIEREALTTAELELGDAADERRSAFLLGVYTAPLFIGFLVFVAERSILDKPGKLFFFTREGEFFSRVFQALFPDKRFSGLGLPSHQLLEVSRLATFCASLQEISTREMMRLWNLYSTQSVYALCKSLGLDPQQLNVLCVKHRLALTEPVTYPWQDQRVIQLFEDTEFRTIVAGKIAAAREILMAYLRQAGWCESDRAVGIVDIGWRGTIQDNLALLLPATEISGYYLGLQRFLNDQPSNSLKHAFGPNLNQRMEFAHLLDSVAPLESLCNSPHGSVTGYQRGQDHRVLAARWIDAAENAVYGRFTTHFQDGVIHAAGHWAKYVSSHAIASDELRGSAGRIWASLLSRPPEQFLQAFTSLNHNETFGVGGFVHKKEAPNTLTVIRGFLTRSGRQGLVFFLKKNQWPRALWQRRDIGVVNRTLLVALMLAARVYKRWRSFMRRRG